MFSKFLAVSSKVMKMLISFELFQFSESALTFQMSLVNHLTVLIGVLSTLLSNKFSGESIFVFEKN